MKILITGGAGFVGSSLAKSLLEESDHEIYMIDDLSTGNYLNILGIINRVMFFERDITDYRYNETLEVILNEVDIVYHLAASIGVKLIQDSPQSTLHNNIDINHILFPLFEKYQNKVIYSSTSEVYGETSCPDGSRETDRLEILPTSNPRGGYACSKLMSEFLLKSYTFPSVVVRFFNVVGPSQVYNYGHVLPRFVKSINTGEPLMVYGDGKQVRSFCDIRDCVEMLKLLMNDVHNGELYNIGNDSNVCTINGLAETVIEVIGGGSIEHTPFDETFGEISTRFPNTDKIQQYYRCKYSLVDTIKYVTQESV